jgi:hypothetical protein
VFLENFKNTRVPGKTPCVSSKENNNVFSFLKPTTSA